MKQRQRLYFAYGANLDRRSMGHRCPQAKILSTASLRGYRFAIEANGVATVVPDQLRAVHGILWRLTPADVQNLDAFEGVHIGAYHRELVDVVPPSGSPTAALIYISASSVPGKPRTGYLEKLIAAANDHGMPESYVTELLGWRIR